MKIYILTDIEGVGRVSVWSQTRESNNVNKAIAMKLLSREINAVVDGILSVYPEAEVFVFDGHGNIGIDALELHPSVYYMLGRSENGDWGLDASFDALFFVGQHALAGTPNAPLCHTYSSQEIEFFELNGKRIGEFGCRVHLAAESGVPTVFISGDDKACDEAAALVPNIHTVVTKKGRGIQSSVTPPLDKLYADLESMAAKAMGNIHSVSHAELSPPYVLRIKSYSGVLPDFISMNARHRLEADGDGVWKFTAERLKDLPI